jgi:transposase
VEEGMFMSPKKKNKKKLGLCSALEIPLIILLANNYLNQLGFVDFINRSVTWDEKQWSVSPGNLAKAIILATFFKVRAPLYIIKNSFEGIDTETLFGKGVLPEHLNDAALAQALDRMSDANLESLFSSFALSMYVKFTIPMNRLHSDTTSLSFYGEYEQCENDEEGLQIVRGYNKDHMPECKQVVVGKIVNEHGLAIINSTMNGNISDIEWNQKALGLIKDLFGKKLDKTIYIADSKLINLPTLKILRDVLQPIRFISRCPDNFYKKVANKMITKAYEENNWQEIGQVSNTKKASLYSTQEFTTDVDGDELRFIVVKTSEGKGRAEREVLKQRKLFEEGITTLGKKTFVCEADAEEEWVRFQKDFRKNLHLAHRELKKLETIKRPRGNPGKNPLPPVIETTWKVSVTIDGLDSERLKQMEQGKECFVLITSVSVNELDQEQVLRQYKAQMVVEVQFHLLKQPALASVIFLKTPSRIDALVMLLNVSLLIRGLMQYKIRKSMKETQEELPRIGANKGVLKNPTTNFLIEALNKAALVREASGRYTYRLYNDYRSLCVRTFFQLLEVDMDDPF